MVNSFVFISRFIKSTEVISLIRLKEVKGRQLFEMGTKDNPGFSTWYRYQMNYEEISEIVIEQVVLYFSMIEPYLGKRFSVSTSELIKPMLEAVLSILRVGISAKSLLKHSQISQ